MANNNNPEEGSDLPVVETQSPKSQKQQEKSQLPKNDVLRNIMNTAKNVTDTSLFKPVTARVRARMKELKEMRAAKSEKIQVGHSKRFVTHKPKVHMTDPEASIINGKGTISYTIWKTDKDGNKITRELYGNQTNAQGQTTKVLADVQFVPLREVIETIEFRKPTHVEFFEAPEQE